MLKNKIWTYEEISKPHTKILRFIGLLPLDGKTFKFFGTRLLNIYWSMNIFLYNLMYIGYGVKMFLRKSFEIDYISDQITVSNIGIRYMLVYYKRQKLEKLMNMCKKLWTYVNADETLIIRRYERKAFYFWNFMMINQFFIVTTFLITAHFTSVPTNDSNKTHLKVLPFRFINEIQEEPMFSVVYAMQTIIVYNITVVNTGLEVASYYLILQACGYLRSIKSRLILLAERQNKIKTDNSKNMYKEIEQIHIDIIMCINFHQHVMVYCEEIERFMRSVFFVGVFSSIYNISMHSLNLFVSNAKFARYAVIIVMNIFQFFMCQWTPEILLTESGAVAEAAYFASLKQVGRQEETNKILHFLIMRAQKPIQLTAGGFIKLSMETFATMIKSAFSFFAILRNSNL